MILRLRHDWPEKANFLLTRPAGRDDYTFLHFLNPVDILVRGKVVHAQGGACIFYPPHTPQWFYSEKPLVHNWFHANKELKETLISLSLPESTLMYPTEDRFISEYFQRAEAESFSPDPLSGIMLETIMQEFLCTLSRRVNSTAPLKVQTENTDKMRFVRRSILSQPEKHWTVREMAQLAGLSPSRFHSVYRSVFGSSPIKDSIDSRIDYAKSLLTSTDLPVSLVAERTGYTDQYHFIRQFKKETGVTPRNYRIKNVF